MANTKITSKVIADANILTAAIADNAVTGDKVADDVALAGNPTTTTQTAGNSTTRVATTAFVSTAISNLVDSSPSALNTLNELAAALGDDANFSTTVTNSIATKLPLSGGTLTGNIAHAGNFSLDVGGNLTLDADGDHTIFAYGGSGEVGRVSNESENLVIYSLKSDKDIKFNGVDSSSTITALTLDMSAAGAATFNAGATFGNDSIISTASGNPSMTVKTGGAGNNPAYLLRAGDNTVFDMMGVFSASTDYWRVGFGTSGSVDTEVLAVSTDKRVGINYTSPSSDLHILGLDGASSAKITVQTDDTASAKASLLLMSRNASNTNKNWELINDEGYGVGISRTSTGPYGIRKMASTTTVTAGDGWVTLTGFTTNSSDIGGHFSGGIFTAPVTGIYSIGSHFNLYAINSTNYFLVKGNHLNSSGSGLGEYYVAHTEYTEGSGGSHNAYNYDAYQALNLYMAKGDIYRYEAFSGSSNGQITTASYFSVCLIG